jgi:LacI family transcriptional regulator
MNKKKPTIMEVARHAEVSVGTVSNVLNEKIRVSEARRQRVLKTMEELGYSQNMLAQGLRRRRTPVVGICVPFTSITYFAALVDAFEDVASDRGFEIMQVLTQLDPDRELQRVRALLKYHVSGIILVPGLRSEATLDVIASSGTPLVIVDRPTQDQRFDQVSFDNRGVMFEATSRLIALGHKRILFVVRQRHLSVTVQRVQGLREASRQGYGNIEIEVLECGYDEASFMARLSPELQGGQRPSVIIVSNSVLAAWTLRALRALGVFCPEEVSLLAFDEPEWADLVTPRLSIIRQPTREIALAAWEFLMRRMNDDTKEAQRVELRAEVVFRESIIPVGQPRSGTTSPRSVE